MLSVEIVGVPALASLVFSLFLFLFFCPSTSSRFFFSFAPLLSWHCCAPSRGLCQPGLCRPTPALPPQPAPTAPTLPTGLAAPYAAIHCPPRAICSPVFAANHGPAANPRPLSHH